MTFPLMQSREGVRLKGFGKSRTTLEGASIALRVCLFAGKVDSKSMDGSSLSIGTNSPACSRDASCSCAGCASDASCHSSCCPSFRSATNETHSAASVKRTARIGRDLRRMVGLNKARDPDCTRSAIKRPDSQVLHKAQTSVTNRPNVSEGLQRVRRREVPAKQQRAKTKRTQRNRTFNGSFWRSVLDKRA